MAGSPFAEEVVYKNVVEGLFVRSLASKLTPRCLDRIREAGIVLGGKLNEYYPRETFYRCVRIAGEELFPDMDENEQMLKLGTAFMEGWKDTLAGRAAMMASRFMGTRRMLLRMADNYRTANNYMKVECHEVGPAEVRLTLSQTSGVPGYFEAAMRTALVLTGGNDVVFHREAYDGVRCTWRITWKP